MVHGGVESGVIVRQAKLLAETVEVGNAYAAVVVVVGVARVAVAVAVGITLVSVLDVETRILGVINCVGIGISRQRRQGPDDGEKAPGQESLPEAKQPYTSTPALDNIWAIAPVSPEARVRCQSRRVVSARATIANDRSYSRASSKAGSTTYSDLQRPQQRAPPALAPCVRCRPGQFQAGTLEGGFVAVGGGQGRGSPDGAGGLVVGFGLVPSTAVLPHSSQLCAGSCSLPQTRRRKYAYLLRLLTKCMIGDLGPVRSEDLAEAAGA